jgi:hypothetical protein
MDVGVVIDKLPPAEHSEEEFQSFDEWTSAADEAAFRGL